MLTGEGAIFVQLGDGYGIGTEDREESLGFDANGLESIR